MSLATPIGGLSNNGAIPKQTNGLLNALRPQNFNAVQSPKPTTSTNPNATPLGQQVPQIGTHPGLLPGVNSSSQSKIVKTDVAGNTTTTHPATPNPSVLAQQQSLNKLGAGLVEDGIAGPKTSAAIANYGTGTSNSTSNSKLDSNTTANNTANYGANTLGQAPDVPINNPTPTPQSPAPQVGSTTQNAQNVLNTGQQTPQEQQTFQGLLSQAATNSPEITAAYQKQQDLQNAYAKQQSAIQGNPIPLEFQQGRGQILANQYGTQLSAAQTGIQQALAQKGLLIQASTAANNAAQTQAGRAQSGANNVLGASLNQPSNYGIPSFNPLTGQFSNNGGQYGTGPQAGVNVQSVKDAQTKINTLDQSSDAINNNFSRAIDYATNAGLTGSSPIIAGFQNRFGTNFATNPAVVGFNQALGALNTQLQSFGEQPIDPNNATQQTLKQAQETVKKDLLTQKSNYQSFIDKFNSSNNSSPGTGSTWNDIFG